MSRKLVTIATFDQPAKARLAQNALTAAGLQAAVGDESLVVMDWLLSNAVGGVKVQVWEEDAERAVEVLEGAFGVDGSGLGPVEGIDPADLAAEAEAAEPEDPAADADRPAADPDEPTDVPPPSRRDVDARRMVFTAILGLMFSPSGFYAAELELVSAPIAFYVFYLFLNAAFGAGELSPRGRFNLFVGGLLMAPFVLVVCTALFFRFSFE